MCEHLLIESQGPWAGPGCNSFFLDGLALAQMGHDVRLFLIQDGVSAALCGAAPTVPALGELARLGGRVWVDDFSLGQRGFERGDLIPEAEIVDIDVLADALQGPATRAVWH